MKCSVYTTAEHGEWTRILGRFDGHDVYFTPGYHRAFELNGDGEARCFCAEESGNILCFPFLIRRISTVAGEPVRDELYDLESVYGYSGPLANTRDVSFLTAAWTAFTSWCREMKIVAGFVRFNPILSNEVFAGPDFKVAQDREVVALRLDCTEDELWKAYPSNQRNMVRKARKHGLTCGELTGPEGLDAFVRLYEDTMRRVDARAYYFFRPEVYQALLSGLDGQVKLFGVRLEEKVIAAAIFLFHGRMMHYHLAGSDAEFRNMAPNNLLMDFAANWGRSRGFQWLHLGGGQSADEHDSLFHFKAGISNLRLKFHTGRCVFDLQSYNRLCAEWKRLRNAEQVPPYFLLYRL